MIGQYILDAEGNPVPEPDVLVWGRWLETSGQRQLGDDVVGVGEVRVSTVFLGLDHGWAGGPPVLWETMVFGGPLHFEQERYTSREEALAGHAYMVERVKLAAAKVDMLPRRRMS